MEIKTNVKVITCVPNTAQHPNNAEDNILPKSPPAGMPPFIDTNMRSKCICKKVGMDRKSKMKPIILIGLMGFSSPFNLFQPENNKTIEKRYAALPNNEKRISERYEPRRPTTLFITGLVDTELREGSSGLYVIRLANRIRDMAI